MPDARAEPPPSYTNTELPGDYPEYDDDGNEIPRPKTSSTPHTASPNRNASQAVPDARAAPPPDYTASDLPGDYPEYDSDGELIVRPKTSQHAASPSRPQGSADARADPSRGYVDTSLPSTAPRHGNEGTAARTGAADAKSSPSGPYAESSMPSISGNRTGQGLLGSSPPNATAGTSCQSSSHAVTTLQLAFLLVAQIVRSAGTVRPGSEVLRYQASGCGFHLHWGSSGLQPALVDPLDMTSLKQVPGARVCGDPLGAQQICKCFGDVHQGSGLRRIDVPIFSFCFFLQHSLGTAMY